MVTWSWTQGKGERRELGQSRFISDFVLKLHLQRWELRGIWTPALKFLSVLHFRDTSVKEPGHFIPVSFLFYRELVDFLHVSHSVNAGVRRSCATERMMKIPKRDKSCTKWKNVFIYFYFYFLEGFCQCQPPLINLLWLFHTYSIESSPFFPFTVPRGIGIPMEVVSSITLLNAETQLILQHKNMPNTTNAYVNFFFFFLNATAIQWNRQSLSPHYS